jgi:hypothetical protein
MPDRESTALRMGIQRGTPAKESSAVLCFIQIPKHTAGTEISVVFGGLGRQRRIRLDREIFPALFGRRSHSLTPVKETLLALGARLRIPGTAARQSSTVLFAREASVLSSILR